MNEAILDLFQWALAHPGSEYSIRQQPDPLWRNGMPAVRITVEVRVPQPNGVAPAQVFAYPISLGSWEIGSAMDLKGMLSHRLRAAAQYVLRLADAWLLAQIASLDREAQP